ncbi:hypothetical protein FIU94_08780 [Sulfitobacter sp. THAF37]|nr:hypothetical protein FIU94_08780 [Sulfitobacter sp. THAF37]
MNSHEGLFDLRDGPEHRLFVVCPAVRNGELTNTVEAFFLRGFLPDEALPDIRAEMEA